MRRRWGPAVAARSQREVSRALQPAATRVDLEERPRRPGARAVVVARGAGSDPSWEAGLVRWEDEVLERVPLAWWEVPVLSWEGVLVPALPVRREGEALELRREVAVLGRVPRA